MSRLVVAILIVGIAVKVQAQGMPVPNSFSSGDVVSASKMNENFQELADRIALLSLSEPWSRSASAGSVSSSTASATVFTVPDDELVYVLREVLLNKGNTVCNMDAGGASYNFSASQETLFLNQGIALQAGQSVNFYCTGISGSGSFQVTVSGYKRVSSDAF